MVLSGGGGSEPESGVLRIIKGERSVKCPHCEQDLDSVNGDLLMSSGTGAFAFAFGKRYIYSCPRCNKVLGVSQRKGFWMG